VLDRNEISAERSDDRLQIAAEHGFGTVIELRAAEQR